MTVEENQATEAFNFKTEVKQVLHILVHSLYKDQDIFLRELVSNASDALTRLHFETLTTRDFWTRMLNWLSISTCRKPATMSRRKLLCGTAALA